MKLVEQHIIKSNDARYKDLCVILHNAKNLYNYALFVVRQHYFKVTGQQYTEDIASDYTKSYVDYYEINRRINKQFDYKLLPANTSQEVLKQLHNNFESFFKLNKMFKEGKLKDKPNIPKYKKKNGMFPVVYNKMTFIQQKEFKTNGIIYLPKNKHLKFKILNYKTCSQIRFIPKHNYILMEVIYDKECKEPLMDNQRYLAIDLGVNNLATCSSNVINSFIINGKPIKSINQYYNKQHAKYKSKLDICQPKLYMSNKLYRLGNKRYYKIKDYFHKASKFIVNKLIQNNINTMVIGKNLYWKQELKMRKDVKQLFVYIPYNTFIDMLAYKCQLHGIAVHIHEESYTSKCSFFDNDYIPTYGVDDHMFKASGRRKYRGMYKSSKCLVNADVNGALNILRKHLKVACDEIISPACRGLVTNPVKINF